MVPIQTAGHECKVSGRQAAQAFSVDFLDLVNAYSLPLPS